MKKAFPKYSRQYRDDSPKPLEDIPITAAVQKAFQLYERDALG